MQLKKRSIKVLAFVVCIAVFFSIICSCAESRKDGRIGDKELLALRQQYPYNDAVSALGSGVPYEELFPTFDALFGNNPYGSGANISAVVVLQLQEDWYSIGGTVKPYNDESLNSLVLEKVPSIGDITWNVHDAVIEKVLYGGDNLKPGDLVTLGFGSTLATAGIALDKTYVSGNRYICFLIDWRNRPPFEHSSLYSTGKNFTFHLTDENITISVTSAPGPDSVSGMYLDAFTTLVNETLGEPDAELTPMEPELEVE